MLLHKKKLNIKWWKIYLNFKGYETIILNLKMRRLNCKSTKIEVP